MLRVLIFLCVLLCAVPASAQENRATPAKSNGSKPQIIVDEKLNAVRIFIDGKEIMRVDANGIHVEGAVGYIMPPPHAAPAPAK